MGWVRDLIFGARDSSPVRMIGFPSDGGLVTAGVTAATTLGLSSVWRCIDILTTGVSQLDWREYREPNLLLPSSRIVRRPEADRTRREWVSLVVATLALFDHCYLIKAGGLDSEGVPVSLMALDDPSIIQPVAPDTFSPLGKPMEFWVGQEKFRRDELVILHRSPLPIPESLGGIIKLARMEFAAALAAEGYASKYWQGGGAPVRYLTTQANMPDPIADQMSARWAEKRSRGPDHVPVMSGGLELKEVGPDPTSESAVEARREFVADAGRYWGIPTRLLNAPTGDSETYTSTEAANMDLLKFTLQNYIGAIEDAISGQLPGGRQMRMYTLPLTMGPFTARAQSYQLATGGKAWMLPDEVREEMELPPAESPDELNPPAPVPVTVGGQDEQGQ